MSKSNTCINPLYIMRKKREAEYKEIGTLALREKKRMETLKGIVQDDRGP